MMRFFFAIVATTLCASLSAAEITVEAKVANNVAIVTAKTEGKVIAFVPRDDGLTSPIPVDLLAPKCAVYTGKPGVYRVLAITAIADKPLWAEATFTIQGPEPPPLPPGPAPVPPPPAPVDDLPRRLRDAYAADASPGKRGQLINLNGIYSAMAKHAADDESIKTSRQLLDVLQKVKEGMLADGILLDMRRIIAAELSAAIGAPNDLPLNREKAAAAFRRIVSSLPTVE